MKVEICCGDLESIKAAKEGGADRIELCSALSEGGITPSLGLIEEAVSTGLSEVNVLIRPRPGDFLYSEDELHLMKDDIKNACKAKATGIVIGVLDRDGEIDKEAMQILISTARKINPRVKITFHRAFDLCNDPMIALEDAIELGCDTILTSGMASSCLEGKEMIKKLVEKASGRIKIMAGGGITPENVREIGDYCEVDLIHGSARRDKVSKMKFQRKGVSMGVSGSDEYTLKVTDANTVNELIKIAALC